MAKIKKLSDQYEYDHSNTELVCVIRDPRQEYTEDQVVDLIQKASDMGFSLDKGSELEGLTVRELDVLVNQRM